MVGGRPRRSFFYAGVQGSGVDAAALYYDPHCAQPALGSIGRPGGARWPLSAADIKSCHCEGLRKMKLTELDPSLALAFLCPRRADFEKWTADARAICAAGQPFLAIQPYPVPDHRCVPDAPPRAPPSPTRGAATATAAGEEEEEPAAGGLLYGGRTDWAVTDDEDEDLVIV
mmetsp:Transcript_18485/g.47299  ORF Transcript_18485/g.47299 Transcript_18485/m.47299 type:complete len:172 (-) Transcript_18485:122-637(-)